MILCYIKEASNQASAAFICACHSHPNTPRQNTFCERMFVCLSLSYIIVQSSPYEVLRLSPPTLTLVFYPPLKSLNQVKKKNANNKGCIISKTLKGFWGQKARVFRFLLFLQAYPSMCYFQHSFGLFFLPFSAFCPFLQMH